MKMQIEEYIEKIRKAPLDKLRNVSWLENHLLLELGLNNEELQEFPVHLHPYCGFGLKSWQYPNQFSKYLVWLSQQNIQSYLEIGCRHGGTFIITVEYLERFSKLALALAVDPFKSDLMQQYAKWKKNVSYLNISSQDLAFSDLLNSNEFDLVLIDGDHSATGVANDYNLLKNSAKFLVFHDVANTVCPGVVCLWQRLKKLYSNTIEFIEQYDSVPQSYLGIGVIDTKEYVYYPLEIDPVLDNIHRPFWSVMIPTYNCADYLAETVKSVLEQDPGSDQMQIEVVDDCSTKDDPEAVVREIGKGRVSFFRQPQNVGATANFNTCVQRAKGQWVHILHGDDTVLPGFYSRLQEALKENLSVGAAFCRYIGVDEEDNWQWISALLKKTPGILSDWLEKVAVANPIVTPAIVVKRSVYEKLGGYHSDLFHTADWEMWKRIAAHYPFWYEPQPLACYREHTNSDTSRLVRTGSNIADIRKSIEISQAYLPLPEAIVNKLTTKSKEHYAHFALNTARQMLAKGDLDAAVAQIREGLKCSSSPPVISSLASLLALPESHQLVEYFASLLTSASFEQTVEAASINEENLREDLKLRDINLIIFPDWSQSEELLTQDLVRVIKAVLTHPDKSHITLLMNADGISDEDVNLIVSGIIMNLFMEENLEVDDAPEVSLVRNSSHTQWQTLLPYLHARIALENEDKAAIDVAKLESIPYCQPESLSNKRAIQLETGAWILKTTDFVEMG